MEILLDALKDSALVFPFLFLIYCIMELIESARNKEKIEKALSGPFAPLASGALGIIPECGFSVLCAKFYDSGLIKIGTLITAFLATSDEGLIILISEGASIKSILLLIFIKLAYAIIVGELLNLILSKYNNHHTCPKEDDCVECGEHHGKKVDKFILHPLFHALKVLLYIFILNIIFGFLLHLVGEDKITSFMERSEYFQPIFTSLVGLIPNCASSVILAEGYINGVVSFAGLMAGLASNAGLGVLLLYRSKKNIKKAVFITFLLFALGLVLGYSTLLFTKIL